MPKNITSVVWSASNLPSGLSFDTATGTFSGTPTVAGEYTVPVTVRTNYGEDTKDVVITENNKYTYLAVETPTGGNHFQVNTFSAYSGMSQTQNIYEGDTLKVDLTDSTQTIKDPATDAEWEFIRYGGAYIASQSYVSQGPSRVDMTGMKQEDAGLISLTNMSGAEASFVSADLNKAIEIARYCSNYSGIQHNSIATMKGYYPYASLSVTLRITSPSLAWLGAGAFQEIYFEFLFAW